MALKIVEKAANGLPLIVEVESLYPFVSENGRDWPVEGLNACAINTSKILEQGVYMPNLKSHPERDYIRTVDVGNGTTVREYVPDSNEEISRTLSIWVDPVTNNLVSRAKLDHSKEAGLEWARLAEKADRGEIDLPISIRVDASCSLPRGKGSCYPYSESVLFWDWLIPGLERPGIPGSGMTRIIEVNRNLTEKPSTKSCCDNCKEGKPCSDDHNAKPLNNSIKENNLNLRTEAREDKSSGGLKTKGAEVMDFDKLIQDLYDQGAPWSAAKAILQGQGADDAVLQKAAMMFMEGGLGDPKLGEEPPPEEMKDKDPSQYEKKRKAFEFKKTFDLARKTTVKTETVKPLVGLAGVAGDSASLGQLLKSNPSALTEAAASVLGLTPQEFKAMGQQYKADLQAKSVKESLEQQVTACRNTKTLFEGHDVSNNELYPIAKVQVAIEDIARSNKNLEVARERLGVRLEKLSFDAAKGIAEAEVKAKLEANKNANQFSFTTADFSQAGISQRYLEQSAKVEKMIAEIFKKYAPNIYAEYERSKKEYAAHIQGHITSLHRATESTYKHRLAESANFVADRKVEATTINKTHMLNLPVFIDGAMEFMYWASPVMRLVSALPSDAINVGQPVRIAGSNKFAQFVQVKTRVRDQRRRFDPRRKITSSAPTRTMTLNEGYQQFFAVRDTSSIRLDRALVDYLGAAPMFENVPDVLIMHLVAEMMMWRQLKVTMELVMSAHRYKLLTISSETTQDVSGERITSSTEGVTLGGITFPNAKTAVWMRRGIASGGTVTYGPVMQPRNKPAINVSGVISESTEYPITLSIGGDTNKVAAQLDGSNNITAINEGDDITDAWAFHPKGILVCRKDYSAEITAGTFIISQYSKVRNYQPVSVAYPGGSTTRAQWGDQKVEELLLLRSDVATLRQAGKPDYALVPEAIFDKTFALSKRFQNSNNLDGLDFAKITSDYSKDVMHAGGNIRGAEILTTNESGLGTDNLIGVMGVKGATVCQELSVPVIDGPHGIQTTDENGLGHITDEDAYRLSETTFIQTIRPLDPTTGEYSEYPISSQFYTDSTESSGIIT